MSDRSEQAEHRTDWAEDRTDWAEDRTVMANERTFAGWMRTGMAALAVAIGLRAVFGPFEPTWIAKSVATIFVIVALVIFWAARQSASSTRDRIDEHTASGQNDTRMTLIAGVLSIGTIATGVILWLL